MRGGCRGHGEDECQMGSGNEREGGVGGKGRRLSFFNFSRATPGTLLVYTVKRCHAAIGQHAG